MCNIAELNPSKSEKGSETFESKSEQISYSSHTSLSSEDYKRLTSKESQKIKCVNQNKQYICEQCGKSFGNKSHLSTHLKIHTYIKHMAVEFVVSCFLRKVI